MAEEIKRKRIYCNNCANATWHTLVGFHTYHTGNGEGADVWGEYRLWKCAGCDTGTMEDHYTADYMASSEDDVQLYDSIYHPRRAHSVRPLKHFFRLPVKLARLYKEVVSSYNEELRLLCAAGLRALIEGVCADKGITAVNLKRKIEGMTKLLPAAIVKNLHGFRFIGNNAVHELEAPNKFQLAQAIEVIEDILNFLYALDYKASTLGRMTASLEKKPVTTVERTALVDAVLQAPAPAAAALRPAPVRDPKKAE